MRLLIEFDGYEKEQNLVGRMLMAYGEFEFFLAKMIAYVLDGDHDRATRILFRVNGEAARIDVADAFLRPYFNQFDLAGKWGNALGALKFCKNVRNQYAHCHWVTTNGLRFVNVDADADTTDDIFKVRLHPVDLPLLQKQHEYFEYTNEWLYFLDCWCRRQGGEKAVPDPAIPKSIPRPPLHNRKKTPPPAPIT